MKACQFESVEITKPGIGCVFCQESKIAKP